MTRNISNVNEWLYELDLTSKYSHMADNLYISKLIVNDLSNIWLRCCMLIRDCGEFRVADLSDMKNIFRKWKETSDD